METDKFKKLLETELSELEASLSKIGRRNADNPDDWEPVPEEWDTTGADSNESSNRIEEFEENSAKLKQLEIRYNNVKKALGKIADGTYGKDEIDDSDIPLDRLEANPSARTKVENSHLVEE